MLVFEEHCVTNLYCPCLHKINFESAMMFHWWVDVVDSMWMDTPGSRFFLFDMGLDHTTQWYKWVFCIVVVTVDVSVLWNFLGDSELPKRLSLWALLGASDGTRTRVETCHPFHLGWTQSGFWTSGLPPQQCFVCDCWVGPTCESCHLFLCMLWRQSKPCCLTNGFLNPVPTFSFCWPFDRCSDHFSFSFVFYELAENVVWIQVDSHHDVPIVLL